MMKILRQCIWGILGLLISVPGWAASPAFLADCQALTRGPHRLAGSPESTAAATYVAQRLHALGVSQVVVQPFSTARQAVSRCTLTLGGRTLPLEPMRPDGIIPPSTDAAGISGPLLYAGRGEMTDFGFISPAGKIVVLDFNSGDGWLRAFRMGARAVIFVANGPAQSQQCHYTLANTNLPRYYFTGDRHALVTGATGAIHSVVTWQHAVAHNVIGFIPGTAPTLALKQDEALVLAANLDTYGEVPSLSPGARGAANCAALLEIAAALRKHPPKRNIVLAFLDGEAFGHAGASALYRALDTSNGILNPATRQADTSAEQASLEQVMASLQGYDNLRDAASKETYRRLKMKADEHAAEIAAQMEELRKAVLALKAAPNPPADQPARLKQFADRIAAAQIVKDHWNDLRRELAHQSVANISADPHDALHGLLRQTMTELRADVALRRRELGEIAQSIAADQAIAGLLGKDLISLHVSLLLGDGTPQWGVLIGGDSALHFHNDEFGKYPKIQKTLDEAATTLALAHFTHETTNGANNPHLFWPAALIHSGEIAGRMGIYNIALGTMQDNLPREGTPDDTLPALNLDRIEAQGSEIAALLGAVADEDSLSLRSTIGSEISYLWPEWKGGTIQGPTVMGMTLGSAVPNKPTAGAVVQLSFKPLLPFGYSPHKFPGFNDYQVTLSDANAAYAFGPVIPDPNNSIMRGFAVKFDAQGQAREVSDSSSLLSPSTRLNIFPCTWTMLQDGKPVFHSFAGAIVLPPQYEATEVQVLQALSDGELDKGKTFAQTADGVTYWYTGRTIDAVKVFSLKSLVGLVSGDLTPSFAKTAPTNGESFGTGYSLLQPWEFPASAFRSAADMWRINETRLDTLRTRGVFNTSVEELHQRAEDLLNDANKATSVASAESLAASAFFAEQPVYNTVRTSLDDLVHAVLILLALAIPFAFALERLLIGSTNIYRQISWFCGFFGLTFFILYLVHPAFAVSKQPVIIFLAFALVVLSALVIFVVMQKFESELKVLQGLTSTVHNADVARSSTIMAAMAMGISTMRRRPLRTALTALTITLLTFTILNFASFDTRTGVVTLFDEENPHYAGVLLHQVSWGSLDSSLLDVLTGRWAHGGVAAASRYWLPVSGTPSAGGDAPMITRGDGTQPVALRGVLGMEPAELTYRPEIGALLGHNAGKLGTGVFLSNALAAKLGLAVGDTAMVGGCKLTVAGLLDSAQVGRVKDMDGTSILPVDFAAMTSSQSGGGAGPQVAPGADVLTAAQNKQNWVPLPVDSVVIVSAQTAKLLGASLRVVTLYTRGAEEATRIAEDISRILPLPVIATRLDGVYTHVLAPMVTATGVKDLIFPILLGGLVIFGTMLGSVADREKEIYTFSALGLAPAHVATLFFAEALVYSFIGGLGGYLLAQGVQRLLNVLVNLGMLSTVPEMNYSSFNAIITILIVMATVLVSAIYPAYKASRSANPGILRSWRLPVPQNDRFDIVFPFTVSQYDITGVMSFLKEHFENFSDTSLGVFMARETAILRINGALGLQANVALAPFDLGVTQTFTLTSAPSEIAGIDEVKITMERLSGQQKDWERLNKVFLNDLRQQFLIWRALPREAMELYRGRTLTTLGEQAGAKPAREAARDTAGTTA